jgi:hypothetical protein
MSTVLGVQLRFEGYRDPKAMGKALKQPASKPARELIAQTLAALECQAVDSAAVTLVITGKFGKSIDRRTPPGSPPYDTDRLSGIAAARTMPRGHGKVDVIVPGPFVFGTPGEQPGQRAARAARLTYMATHEAQHVGMYQRGERLMEGPHHYLGQGTASHDFRATAEIVLEEYRAEAAAARLCTPPEPYWESVPSALKGLRAALVDAVELRYPDEPIRRTWLTAFGAAHNTWVVMGYLAGNLQAAGSAAAVPDELASSELWQRFVQLHWSDFADLCGALSAGDEACTAEALGATVAGLSELLGVWLQSIGFELSDTEDGLYFDVLRHDF